MVIIQRGAKIMVNKVTADSSARETSTPQKSRDANIADIRRQIAGLRPDPLQSNDGMYRWGSASAKEKIIDLENELRRLGFDPAVNKDCNGSIFSENVKKQNII